MFNLHAMAAAAKVAVAYRDQAAEASDAQTTWEGMGKGERMLHHGIHGLIGGTTAGALAGVPLMLSATSPALSHSDAISRFGLGGKLLALGALGGGALGAMAGSGDRPAMGMRGLALDNVHSNATKRFNKNKAKEEADAAKVKKANALTSIEGALARRGASAISRAVPTAAEQALGHATASAASHGIPRNVSALVGEAGSGVRAIPKGPPPVPAQAKGLFAAPAVSPFAGTSPGAARPIAPVAPAAPGSMGHASFLARQPGGQGQLEAFDQIHQMAQMAQMPQARLDALAPRLQQAGVHGTVMSHRGALQLQGMKLSEHLKFAASMARQGSLGTAKSSPKSTKIRNSQLGVSFGQLIESLAGSGAA